MGAYIAASPTFYLSNRGISIYTLYYNSMPGVCARCTARKGIDREGKECYHHRHDNYCRSEIGNGGWSVATRKML
ncbi:MAG: hypothetical protein SPL43_04085 [Prevotella sp.]|nr:hypothetical protein [Prevotella sp.]